MSLVENAEELLHNRILAAHEHGDGHLLAQLYLDAANRMRSDKNNEAVAFLLTQAYVFALDSGSDLAVELHKELVELGSEI